MVNVAYLVPQLTLRQREVMEALLRRPQAVYATGRSEDDEHIIRLDLHSKRETV